MTSRGSPRVSASRRAGSSDVDDAVSSAPISASPKGCTETMDAIPSATASATVARKLAIRPAFSGAQVSARRIGSSDSRLMR